MCTIAPLRMPPRQQYTKGRQPLCRSPNVSSRWRAIFSRDQCRSLSLRFERCDLGKQGADAGAFLIVQHGYINRPRKMVVSIFGRRTDIQDVVESVKSL